MPYLGNVPSSFNVGTNNIDNGAVTTEKIADGAVVNADVSASAAIAGAKISPDFGSQNLLTTGTATAASFIPSSSTAPTNGVYLPAANTVGISTGGSGRLFVNSSGQVGIGATPDATLTVDSGAAGLLANFNSSATNGGYIVGKSSGTAVWDLGTAKQALNVGGASDVGLSTRTGFLAFGTVSQERLRITSAGLVGVGTSSPVAGAQLTVAGSALAVTGQNLDHSANSIRIGQEGSGAAQIRCYGPNTSTNGSLTFKMSRSDGTNSQDVVIDGSGRLGIGTSSPADALHVVGKIAVTGTNPSIRQTVQTANLDLCGGTTVGTDSSIQLYGSSSPSDANHTFYNSNVHIWRNAAGSTQYGRFDSSGRLGIGVTSVGTKLHVKQTDSGQGVWAEHPSNDTQIRLGIDSANSRAALNASYSTTGSYYPIAFLTSDTERARIDTSGRFLVGTSSSIVNGDLLQIASDNTNCLALLSGRNDIYAPRIDICKSRGTTASPIAVANGDQLMNIYVFGHDGSTYRSAASIEAYVDGTPGSNDMPGRLVFSTTADGASSPTERMKINNTGSLTVNGATSVAGGTHTIQDSGSSPNTVRLYNNTDSNNTINRFLICDAGASVLRAEIRSNGGLANYSANNANLSDRNAKKDISPAAGTWDCIKEWEIVNYRYKDQPDDADLNLGVIAQQVAESCPEVITVFQEAKDDQPEKLGIKEQQMYWMAIKALQEAQVRIESLEAINADLLARVTALESV